jgi:pimeloyl-ACP methyl ester carboxylesterase
MALSKAIDADLQEVSLGPSLPSVHYYVDHKASGSDAGRPVVLIHSINAAPSAMEMKPLFDYFRGKRPVYALELPGFGHSPRKDFPYSPGFYAKVIAAFLNKLPTSQPAHVIALSLSAEFLLRAILEEGARVATNILISPTGLGTRQPKSSPAAQSVTGFLGRSVIGTALWRALVSRPSIRFFLGQAFEGDPPASLINYAHETAHQPGAKYAPFAFLSMALFTENAFDVLYARLTTPSLILYDRDPNIGFERLDELVATNSLVDAERISPSLGLPHWEHTDRTGDCIVRFWQALGH